MLLKFVKQKCCVRSYIILRVSEFWGFNAGRWGSMGNNQSRHIWLENSLIYVSYI